MTYAELKQMSGEPQVKVEVITCNEPGCDDEKIEAKGKCNKHYLRSRRRINDPNAVFQAEPKTVTYKGETHTMSEWAVITGIGATTMNTRLKKGKSVEYALFTPPRFRIDVPRPKNK